MRELSSFQRVLCYAQPVDMRKSFDGLIAVCRHEMKEDVFSPTLFIFVGRSRKLAKLLFWDRTGFCIYSKRLERGRFSLRAGVLTLQEVSFFLDGIALYERQNTHGDVYASV